MSKKIKLNVTAVDSEGIEVNYNLEKDYSITQYNFIKETTSSGQLLNQLDLGYLAEDKAEYYAFANVLEDKKITNIIYTFINEENNKEIELFNSNYLPGKEIKFEFSSGYNFRQPSGIAIPIEAEDDAALTIRFKFIFE